MRVVFSKGLAAISKPRCGSTSTRRMLNNLMAEGDIACDVGKKGAVLQPHITAPALRQVIKDMGRDPSQLTFFMTVRNPYTMLWSCYKYFKPDTAGLYNFQEGWSGQPMPYDEWVAAGRAPVVRDWLKLGPPSISPRDLSPLSYEFRALNADGSSAVDKIFKIEEIGLMADWLEERTGVKLKTVHVNGSEGGSAPELSKALQDRVKKLFPFESRLYDL